MIRHEEALGQTLRVAPGGRQAPPDVVSPTAGQAYFKLMPDALADAEGAAARDMVDAFLLRERDALTFPVSGERAPFLEHFLDGSYRRERAARFSGDDEGESSHVVGFPTFHDAQRGELRTLLRFPVNPPEWLDARGAAWVVPRYRDRVGRHGLAPPALVRIVETPPEEDDAVVPLPYALDPQTASRSLGICEEHVGRLLDELAAQDGVPPGTMLAAVTALLGAPAGAYPEDAVAAAFVAEIDPREALASLLRVVAALPLAGRVRAFPVALAWDASQVMTTHGLQKDLRALLGEVAPRTGATPLGAYLLGTPPAADAGVHVGLRGPHPLTPEQRAVADRALKQRLVCAQGPPGTGKTELILNLAAHRITAQMAKATPGSPPALPQRGPLVVTSTNNRAVDNVIAPLSTELPPERLPLALRLGSRLVMQEVTVPTLQRTLAWLDRGDPERATARWAALQAETAALREALHGEIKAHAQALVAVAELPAARARVEALEAQVAAHRARLEALGPAQAELVRRALAVAAAWADDAHDALGRLERLSRVSATRAQRLWKTARREHGEALQAAVGGLGVALRLPKQPASHVAGSDWVGAFEALEAALRQVGRDVWSLLPGEAAGGDTDPADIGALEEDLDDALERVRKLDKALPRGELGPDPREGEGAAAREVALFELACEARECWALIHKERLRGLLKDLIAPSTRGGLRAQLEEEAVRRELFELFPVVGCTLLSLGNAFPLERGAIDHVVIDEAGQCHPAYAVSALARAARALVIGDRHQLEPVIGLDQTEEQRVLRRTACPLAEVALAPFRATSSAGRSAQTLAARGAGEVLHLRDHFRCQPAIIRISDALCGYGLRIVTPPGSLAQQTSHLPEPVILHDVRGEQVPRAGSWANDAEVERVGALVRALLRDGVQAGQIAVLTPYRGQLVALRQRFKQDGVPLDDRVEMDLQGQLFAEIAPSSVAVGTVHRFQGGERDVVIFSTVVTRERSLAFSNAKVNLVNVAVSRARQHLVVVGHADVLDRGAVTRVLRRAAWQAPALALAEGSWR